MNKTPRRKDNIEFPQIRLTRLANKRLDELVKANLAIGLAVSKTSLASQIIMQMPIPGQENEFCAKCRQRILQEAAR